MSWPVLLLLFVGALADDLDKCCKSPETTSRLLSQDVFENSPYYAVAVPRTPKTELIDNICYTYFENDNGDLLNIISVVFHNGASEQHIYSVSDYDDNEGVSLSKSPGCCFLDYTLNDVCCGDVFTLYRCFVNKDSCNEFETDIGCIPGRDVRLALASKPHLSCNCEECVLTKLLCDERFCGNDFILLPNLLCPQCVTEYNCRDAIRAKCAVGEICINDCCRLAPHLPAPVPQFSPAGVFPPGPLIHHEPIHAAHYDLPGPAHVSHIADHSSIPIHYFYSK